MKDARVEAVAAFYESLSPDTLDRLNSLYADDAWFKDPFNEVRGIAAITRIFRHMFDQVEQPRFEVTTRIVEGDAAMLGWVFRFVMRGRAVEIRGVSHLVFDTQSRVAIHRDYWDAAEELYAKLPLIGRVFRWLASRLAAG